MKKELINIGFERINGMLIYNKDGMTEIWYVNDMFYLAGIDYPNKVHAFKADEIISIDDVLLLIDLLF